MVLRLFFLIFFYVCINAYPQGVDSTIILNDTLNNVAADSLAPADTLAFLSAEKSLKTDSVIHIHQNPFYEQSSFISSENILKKNYRYAGDFFRSANFYFEKDLGRVGQNNEVILYGTGFGGISYLKDGILMNSRLTNSLNLNLIQSEYIDSVEILPSPRGFLYSSFNNPVSVNFIGKDFVADTPYSRIKYYEGPDGEAMFDGIFNALLSKNINLFFEVTNRKADSLYRNTNFGLWQANVKLKYFVSDSLNLTGSYFFNDYEVGLYGGADADSILEIASDVNDYLASTVNPVQVPVVFPFKKEKILSHYFNLRLLGNIYKNYYSDFNLYYKYYENKITDIPAFYLSHKSETYGTQLRQKLSIKFIDIDVTGNYERNEFPYLSAFVKADNFSFSPVISANFFNNKFIPSFFYKYTGISYSAGTGDNFNNNYSGIGFDLYFYLLKKLSLYGGYSLYENPGSSSKVNNLELGLKSSFKNLIINLKYFSRKNFINNYAVFFIDSVFNNPANISGISADINFRIWNIYLETISSYYFTPDQMNSNDNKNLFYIVPEFSFDGGLYYKDILFDENLNLKTGLNFKYAGKRNITSPYFNYVDPFYRLDFMVAGEIQNAAILYFIWENLTDNYYYAVPFYPMPERSIRFGVAWEIFN